MRASFLSIAASGQLLPPLLVKTPRLWVSSLFLDFTCRLPLTTIPSSWRNVWAHSDVALLVHQSPFSSGATSPIPSLFPPHT